MSINIPSVEELVAECRAGFEKHYELPLCVLTPSAQAFYTEIFALFAEAQHKQYLLIAELAEPMFAAMNAAADSMDASKATGADLDRIVGLTGTFRIDDPENAR